MFRRTDALLIYLSLILLGAVSYVIVQILLIVAWRNLPIAPSLPLPDKPLVSIVVAVRNEAAYITSCVVSLFDQTYPGQHYEVIVVDNHSTDQTLTVCRALQGDYPITVIDLSTTHESTSSFKKEALTAGIARAKGKIVLTTDGDCTVPNTWIEAMTTMLSVGHTLFVTGPVLLQAEPQLLHKYQLLEVMSLMVATGGGIQSGLLLMSNGANLGFWKSSFEQIDGYKMKAQAASGDDVFLLQKIASINPASVAFIKSPTAIVKTHSVTGFQSFLSQRKRWASKASQYQHVATKVTAIVVVFNSILICIGAVLALLFHGPYIMIFLGHLASKVAVDAWMISEGKHFFNKRSKWYQDLFAHLFNPLANVLILVATMSSRKYLWKDRLTR